MGVVASRATNSALLEAYCAQTAASFYEKHGCAQLSFILNLIAISSAEEVQCQDYAVSVHGNAALRLLHEDRTGLAAFHLKAAERFASAANPANRYILYKTAAECYAKLGAWEREREYWQKAASVPGIPDEQRNTASFAAANTAQHIQYLHPTVWITGLASVETCFEIGKTKYKMLTTSKHELYDQLLNFTDRMSRTSRSIIERSLALGFQRAHRDCIDTTIHTALEIGLSDAALAHLEEHKCAILRTRLAYSRKSKPASVDPRLWDTFLRLCDTYRSSVETTTATSAIPYGSDPEAVPFHTPGELADALAMHSAHATKGDGRGSVLARNGRSYRELPTSIRFPGSRDTVVLEYYSGSNEGACFILRPEDCRTPQVIRLPLATNSLCESLAGTFSALVEQWTASVASGSKEELGGWTDAWAAALRTMDEIFYEPIRTTLQSMSPKRICLIPCRGLHAVPMNLMGDRLEGESIASKLPVTFMPSLSALGSLADENIALPRRAFVVADPVPHCRSGRSTCRNPRTDCLGMPAARGEIAAVMSILGQHGVACSAVQGSDATLSAAMAGFSDADLIHVASHGRVDLLDPMRSGLLVASNPDDEEELREPTAAWLCPLSKPGDPDGENRVGEIFSVHHAWAGLEMSSCLLLNLASCSTGRVDWRDLADEYQGLANGFIHAGAKCVVSSIWPIHDAFSSWFNAIFYEELASAGWSPSGALKMTVAEFVRRLSLRLGPFDGLGSLLGQVGGRREDPQASLANQPLWAGYRIVGVPF